MVQLKTIGYRSNHRTIKLLQQKYAENTSKT